MEHLNMTTVEGSQFNLDALYQICPSCFTEVADNQGGVKRVVDFNKLRSLLGDNAEESAPESYDFNWVGKRAAQRDAAASINKTLRPCPEESIDWDTTQNLYIEGDNLEVLKLLQNSYMGKVKMIYIDPPYNTGKDFIYPDRYDMSDKEYVQEANLLDEKGNKLIKNLESSGRFHSRWCSMIYMRLLVARSLLSPDGIIFISIGEQEIDNLKKIVTEVFGTSNYIETYIWESTFRPDNSSKIMRRNGEYVLCIAKDKSNITKLIGEIKPKEGLPSLTKSSMKESVLSFPAGVVKTFLGDGIYKAGVRDSYTLLDDAIVEKGKIINSFRLKGHMIWGQENLEREIANGTEIIIKGDNFVPYSNKPGDSVMSPTKLIPNSVVGDVLSANAEMSKLFSEKVFSYPKPVSLIKYLIRYIDDKDFIVMDFFSGSSTTAQAVFELNSEDNGNRKFIMVQYPEDLDEMLSLAEDKERVVVNNAISLCDSINRNHCICEVAKERISRAGKKVKEAHSDVHNLDTGFRVFKCDSSNMKDVYFSPTEYSQTLLTGLEDNIKKDRTDLDLLFDCMLRWGVELTLPVSSIKEANCTIHNVNDGDLVACFDGKITDVVIDKIADMNPLRVVFRDSNFDEASQKMNLFELFKQKCNWTEQEVINNVKVI